MARRGSRGRSEKTASSQPADRKAASRAKWPHAPSGSESEDRWRPWLLGGATALVVARPIYPSESPADTGDGLPVVILWLALAVLWMLGVLGRRQFRLRFGLLDVLVVFIVLWTSGAALLGAWHSHARPAVNMLWEWVGLGLVFILVRQWLAGPRQTRAIVAVMVSLAVGLAGYGLFQCVYEFPRTRAAYYADPEKALQGAGLNYPAGSPERIAFEKRLESREPIATFALTNSLAGFLTPWLVLAGGIALRGGRSAGWRPILGLILALFVMGACLLLTKSRTAYLAVLLGGGTLLVGWMLHQRGQVQSGLWRRVLVASAVGLLLLSAMIGAAFYLGGLDVQVLTEAQKSLGYRMEYWQGTCQIIRKHPVWGCGPGLFRYAYTQVKLPQASEEIADPHNFLFEVWATAGTPAVLAMLAFLGLWAWYVLVITRNRHPDYPDDPKQAESGPGMPLAQPGTLSKSLLQSSEPKNRGERTTGSERKGASSAEFPPAIRQGDHPFFPLLGGAVGVILGYFVGQWTTAPPSVRFLLVGIPLEMVTIWAFWPWVQRGAYSPELATPPAAGRNPKAATPEAGGNLSPALLAVAGAALLVNLLGAGGISFAGVAGSLWLLAALATGTPETLAPLASRSSPPQLTSNEEKARVENPPGHSDGLETRGLETRGLKVWGLGGRKSGSQGHEVCLRWFDWEHQLPWLVGVGGLFGTMALFFACHQTAFSPVLQCQGMVRQAIEVADTDPARAEHLLQKAAVADPLSAVPAEWLSALAFQEFAKRQGRSEAEAMVWVQRFEHYADLALQLNPEDATAWWIQGQRFLEIGHRYVRHSQSQVSGEPPGPVQADRPAPGQLGAPPMPPQAVPQAEREVRPAAVRQALRAYHKALSCLQQAVALYPHKALYRARLAEAFGAVRYPAGMIREAEAALQLDEQMPHVEKKLPEALRHRVARMRDGLYN